MTVEEMIKELQKCPWYLPVRVEVDFGFSVSVSGISDYTGTIYDPVDGMLIGDKEATELKGCEQCIVMTKL